MIPRGLSSLTDETDALYPSSVTERDLCSSGYRYTFMRAHNAGREKRKRVKMSICPLRAASFTGSWTDKHRDLGNGRSDLAQKKKTASDFESRKWDKEGL